MLVHCVWACSRSFAHMNAYLNKQVCRWESSMAPLSVLLVYFFDLSLEGSVDGICIMMLLKMVFHNQNVWTQDLWWLWQPSSPSGLFSVPVKWDTNVTGVRQCSETHLENSVSVIVRICCQLDTLGRGNLNWGAASIRLACGHVCRHFLDF